MSKVKYKDRKYSIESYNSEWVDRYKNEADELRKCLGESILSIEHIGSTSVPQLTGKPIIDILVIVEDIKRVDNFTKSLELLGYKYLGQYVMEGSHLFVKEEDGVRLVNLHFYHKGHPHIDSMLGLRNYLRTHPDVVKKYSELKLKLITEYPNDYGSYRKYKDEWMNALKQEIGLNK